MRMIDRFLNERWREVKKKCGPEVYMIKISRPHMGFASAHTQSCVMYTVLDRVQPRHVQMPLWKNQAIGGGLLSSDAAFVGAPTQINRMTEGGWYQEGTRQVKTTRDDEHVSSSPTQRICERV